MSDALYHERLVALARAAHGAGRLAHPQAVATVDNPMCGDRVTIELSMDGGRVSALAHKVRGCLLCEASASLIGAHAPDATPDTLRAMADGMRALVVDGADPPGAWPEAAAFRPVHDTRSRHRCVLLPFEALVQALGELKS